MVFSLLFLACGGGEGAEIDILQENENLESN